MLYFSVYNVHSWTAEDVGQWLENMSLAEYKDSFIRNEIRGMELLHLDKTDIQVCCSFDFMIEYCKSISEDT